MTDRRALVLAFLLAFPSTSAAAEADADRPVAVSPGHPARLLGVADRCPTFSWGQVAGAESYELVVYRVGRDEEAAPAVLRARIDGRAGSWTPRLGRCLEPGGRYAWSLRARRGETISAWSVPALFQVAPGPSAAELDAALAVVRDFAAAGGLPESAASSSDRSQARAGTGGTSSRKDAEPDPADPDPADPGSADPGPGGSVVPTAFEVDGGIAAASFSGDGSGLANVDAAGLSCVGCVAAGQLQDGAVTVAKIGVGCDSGQVLMKGPAGWECATLTAPACTPGDGIGCYTGPTGTQGVGECVGGTRTCAGDSTWGGCSGEIIPAAAEICDGLDNTCDGSIDLGDAATLCPPTANVVATLCEAAACSIASCADLWADEDGDYANGCEAPAPGACLDGGVPRPITAPSEGDLVIQEFLADPASPLTDAAGEWFEVAVEASVDLNSLAIGTTFGTVVDQVDAADCLTVQVGDLLLFARSADPAINGDLDPDQLFSFSLVNGGGALHLAYDGNLVDAIAWAADDVTPGQARNLPAAFQDAISNDDQANWCTVPAEAGLLYSVGNHGSPGLMNIACP